MIIVRRNDLDLVLDEIENDLKRRFVILEKPLEIGFVALGETYQFSSPIKTIQGFSTNREFHLVLESQNPGYEFASFIL